MPEESVLPWSGEGPPPAGTVCEVDGSAGISGFDSCTILYSSRNVMVWQYIGTDFENCSYAGEREFRPIRTPEQIASEEIEAILSWMVNRDYDRGLLGIAEDLHADGYRRQVTP
ncbi:hypothetical protein ACQKDL_13070 [Pseudomonas bubulae]|nr:hypothetical protein [Pseudomonas fluorescens]